MVVTCLIAHLYMLLSCPGPPLPTPSLAIPESTLPIHYLLEWLSGLYWFMQLKRTCSLLVSDITGLRVQTPSRVWWLLSFLGSASWCMWFILNIQMWEDDCSGFKPSIFCPSRWKTERMKHVLKLKKTTTNLIVFHWFIWGMCPFLNQSQ